jgi:hypothetical protein
LKSAKEDNEKDDEVVVVVVVGVNMVELEVVVALAE